MSDKAQKLLKNLQKQMEVGTSGLQVKSPRPQEQFVNINRDVGLIRPQLMASACANTQLLLETDEELEVLDTVVCCLEKLYADGLEKQENIQQFHRMYNALHEAYGETGWRVYALFCCLFMQAVYCYMFATAANASGLLATNQETLDTYAQQLSFLSDIDPEIRGQLFSNLRELGAWPPGILPRKFSGQLEDFLDVIRKDQEKRRHAADDQ